MEETSEELPNFSIGIDLLGPDPTSNKNGARKNIASCTFRKFVGGPAAEIEYRIDGVTAGCDKIQKLVPE